jgi:hypothetical protein
MSELAIGWPGKTLDTIPAKTPSPQALCAGTSAGFSNPPTGPAWNGWGVNTSNTRFQDAIESGLMATQISRLKLKCAFGFPGDIMVTSNGAPTVAGGRVFAGAPDGKVYVLGLVTSYTFGGFVYILLA